MNNLAAFLAAVLAGLALPASATTCGTDCVQACRAPGHSLLPEAINQCVARCTIERQRICAIEHTRGPTIGAGVTNDGAGVVIAPHRPSPIAPVPLVHHRQHAAPPPAPPPPPPPPSPPPYPVDAASGAVTAGMTYPPPALPRADGTAWAHAVPPAGGDSAPGAFPTRSIATRLFTDAKFRIPDDFGAIAVLVFPPDAAQDTDRVLKVCRAFVGALFDAGAVARSDPRWQQMVTIWPVRSGSAALDPNNEDVHGAGADRAVCPAAVADYDYLEAEKWLDRLPRNVDFGRGRGPFLIAWAPARMAGAPHVPILTYDLSVFQSPTELRNAMTIWAGEIEENPQAWASGWDLTRFRLQAAAQADRFGAQIGAAMKLVPWLGDH